MQDGQVTRKEGRTFELEEGILAFTKTLFEEHKSKANEDVHLATLAGKADEEILDEVVLDSLKTLSTEEVQRKVVEEDTMMDINGQPMREAVILESIVACTK